jgi:hypothetical protein
MSALTDLDPEGKRALAAAARAFARAQRKGYVWVNEDGFYESHEGQLAWVPSDPIHPDQLRFA